MVDDPLATLTPAEALHLRGSPERLAEWLARHGLTAPPKGYFGRVAALAFEAECERDRVDAERHQAARWTHANRRRPNVERLVYMMDSDLRERLPAGMVQVFALCVEEGLSNAAAAERLGVSTSTVRKRLARLREIMRNNLHVKHVPRSQQFAAARAGQ